MSVVARACVGGMRLSSARRCKAMLSSQAEAGGKGVKFGLQPAELKAYKRKMRELRLEWRSEEAARRQSSAAEEEEERVRRAATKAARRDAASRASAEKRVELDRLRAEAATAQRVRVEAAVSKGRQHQDERLERQRRLVSALEEESVYWLTTDAKVDEHITDALWDEPGSTGLVTDHSHMYWRYMAEVDRFTFFPPDLSAVSPTPAEEERKRIATTTERLIRTQTSSLLEFHDVLDDAANIAEAIKDMKVEQIKPRVTWTPPPQQTDDNADPPSSASSQ